MDYKPNLYVYRSNSGKFWWCAVPWVDQKGKRHQRRKTFRDSRLGGKDDALRAARAWRDDAMTDPDVLRVQDARKTMSLITVEDPEAIGPRDNPFGLVGITAAFREKPLGGNFSVTANRGRKKWFSMRRYGPLKAFKKAVAQRCKWVGVPMPNDDDLEQRFRGWEKNNRDQLHRYNVSGE